MSITGGAMIAVMVVVFAWLGRVIAGGAYPKGYFTSTQPVPPFWVFMGYSLALTGVMFQLTWIHGASPLFLLLTPVGALIAATYATACRRRSSQNSL